MVFFAKHLRIYKNSITFNAMSIEADTPVLDEIVSDSISLLDKVHDWTHIQNILRPNKDQIYGVDELQMIAKGNPKFFPHKDGFTYKGLISFSLDGIIGEEDHYIIRSLLQQRDPEIEVFVGEINVGIFELYHKRNPLAIKHLGLKSSRILSILKMFVGNGVSYAELLDYCIGRPGESKVEILGKLLVNRYYEIRTYARGILDQVGYDVPSITTGRARVQASMKHAHITRPTPESFEDEIYAGLVDASLVVGCLPSAFYGINGVDFEMHPRLGYPVKVGIRSLSEYYRGKNDTATANKLMILHRQLKSA